MKVMHAGRQITVNVAADGDGLVSHAGSALLAQVADKTGLTRALSLAVGEPGLRAGSHDRGRVIRDLAVMLADGGDCLADLRAVGDQAVLFGATASPSTAFRVIDRVASTPGLLDALSDAHARARERVWELAGAPRRLTIDLDATLITAHSEKDQAAGTFKGGYGFAPMLAYGDETGEALAGELRAGNAGANNAADQIAVAEQAIAQIPAGHIETLEIVLRVDSAGASHELIDWCREGQIEFSVGYDLTETVRAAILKIPESDWVCSLEQDGHARSNGQVCEITEHLDLQTWPDGTRVIVRRERAHPGAQLSFTDDNGYRFQVFITNQHGRRIERLEQLHRAHALVEDRIRCGKDTGLRNLPFRGFQPNAAWLELVLIAQDILAWTQRLLLEGELARCEPKRLRYRLLHVAGRLTRHARRLRLHLPCGWAWGDPLLQAFARLRALPQAP